MKVNEMLQAWGDSDGLAGTPIVDAKVLASVAGGMVGSGWISSVSGDCNGGTSCWDYLDALWNCSPSC